MSARPSPELSNLIALEAALTYAEGEGLEAFQRRIDTALERRDALNARLASVGADAPSTTGDTSVADQLAADPTSEIDFAALQAARREARALNEDWDGQRQVLSAAIGRVDAEIAGIEAERVQNATTIEEARRDFAYAAYNYLLDRFRAAFETLCDETLLPLHGLIEMRDRAGEPVLSPRPASGRIDPASLIEIDRWEPASDGQPGGLHSEKLYPPTASRDQLARRIDTFRAQLAAHASSK